MGDDVSEPEGEIEDVSRRTNSLVLKLLEVEWEGEVPQVVLENEFESREQAVQVMGVTIMALVGLIRHEAPELAEQLRSKLWDTAFASAESWLREENPDGE